MNTQTQKSVVKKLYCVSIDTYAYVEARNGNEALDLVVGALNKDLDENPETGIYFRSYEAQVEDQETGKMWNDDDEEQVNLLGADYRISPWSAP